MLRESNHEKTSFVLPVLALMVMALVISGCGPAATSVLPTATPVSPTSTPIPPTATPVPPTATPVPPTATPMLPTPTPELAEDGKVLFTQKGCAACHGSNAEGAGIGPALAGHSREQVFEMVRNPMGNMPAFTEEQVSDEELKEIAAFIADLELVAEHGHEYELAAATSVHLQMALQALQADNVEDAKHHVQHLLDVTTGEAKETAKAILTDLEAGNHHDAEHDIEGMLVQAPEAELSAVVLHLQLALDALHREDLADAQHHLQHAIEASTDEAEKARLADLLTDLQAGETREVEQHIEEMIKAEEKEVVIQGFAFNPERITVPVGTTVTWVQQDSVLHTVTSKENLFDSGLPSKGDSFSFTFTETGTYEYFCRPHSQMIGTIVVQ
ncbi:MAG: c-type cytochrome [Anaerolineae bacterium]